MSVKPKVPIEFAAFVTENDKDGFDFVVPDLKHLVIQTEKMDLIDAILYASKILEYRVHKKWEKLGHPIPTMLDYVVEKSIHDPKAQLVRLRVDVMKYIRRDELQPVTLMLPNWACNRRNLEANAIKGIIYGNYRVI